MSVTIGIRQCVASADQSSRYCVSVANVNTSARRRTWLSSAPIGRLCFASRKTARLRHVGSAFRPFMKPGGGLVVGGSEFGIFTLDHLIPVGGRRQGFGGGKPGRKAITTSREPRRLSGYTLGKVFALAIGLTRAITVQSEQTTEANMPQPAAVGAAFSASRV